MTSWDQQRIRDLERKVTALQADLRDLYALLAELDHPPAQPPDRTEGAPPC